MRLVTYQREGTAAAGVQVGQEVVELPFADIGELLRVEGWRDLVSELGGRRHPLDDLQLLAPVPRPGKVICVGHNYLEHIREMGVEVPTHPTLFAKFPTSLIGPTAPIRLPAESAQPDWEAELALVIGRTARRVTEDRAADHIAGYSVLNDVSMRDWQGRTSQFLQGKAFDGTTPWGPAVVTLDELPEAHDLAVECRIDGELKQSGRTRDLVFTPAALVAYVSQFCTLEPGDLISTGTPSGVGAARNPPERLLSGQVVTTRVEGVGELRNRCVPEQT